MFLHFQLSLPTRSEAQRMQVGPAVLKFEISNYVMSQLQITNLQVQDGSHSFAPYRWLRYVTLSDSYMIRI